MKKLFLIFALLASSFVAHAGPLEELSAAFDSARVKTTDMVQPASITQTVVRGYLSTKSGMLSVTNATQYIGFLASKSVAQSAISGLGYTFISSQGMMDIYRAPVVSTSTGFILLVYYDTFGNASEIYLLNDTLP